MSWKRAVNNRTLNRVYSSINLENFTKENIVDEDMDSFDFVDDE